MAGKSGSARATELGVYPWPGGPGWLPRYLELVGKLGGQDSGCPPFVQIREQNLFESTVEALVELGLIEVRLTPKGERALIDAHHPSGEPQ